jgi:DNA adenine methylase
MSTLKAPFPYFGGKSQAATAVWSALGDVHHYVDPFVGSMAVPFLRPHPCGRGTHYETFNDKDGLLVNVWRSIQLKPDEVAEHASWIVSEADLHARHMALVTWKANHDLERLMADHDFCDPRMAGYWIYGLSSWIGSGFCSGKGAWKANRDGVLSKTKGEGPGISRQVPFLSRSGQGVNTQSHWVQGMMDTGVVLDGVRDWMRFLSARLRHARILNGDWSRALTNSALGLRPKDDKVIGIFLDPPYGGDVRQEGLYAEDSGDIATSVREWCAQNGNNPKVRVVLAGYDTEHTQLETLGWSVVEWWEDKGMNGGYSGSSKNGTQQHRERLWLSPSCVPEQRKAEDLESLFNLQ